MKIIHISCRLFSIFFTIFFFFFSFLFSFTQMIHWLLYEYHGTSMINSRNISSFSDHWDVIHVKCSSYKWIRSKMPTFYASERFLFMKVHCFTLIAAVGVSIKIVSLSFVPIFFVHSHCVLNNFCSRARIIFND